MFSVNGEKYCAHCGYRQNVSVRTFMDETKRYVECTNTFSDCPLRNITIREESLLNFPHWLYGSNKNYDFVSGKQLFPVDSAWEWWNYGQGYLF